MRLRWAIALLWSASALSMAHASSGVAIDPQGKPIEGVRVCYVAGDIENLCVETGKDGSWSMPSGDLDTVRLTHALFLPETIGGGEQPEPVMLRAAAVLIVRLEDASGEPITDGEVEVLLTSGHRYGPFPVQTEKGTIINSLDPGPVAIVARSEGFEEKRAEEDELPAGERTTVVVRLERTSK